MKVCIACAVLLISVTVSAIAPLPAPEPLPVMLTCIGNDAVGESFCAEVSERFFRPTNNFRPMSQRSSSAITVECVFEKDSQSANVVGNCRNQVQPVAGFAMIAAQARDFAYVGSNASVAAFEQAEQVNRLADRYLRL